MDAAHRLDHLDHLDLVARLGAGLDEGRFDGLRTLLTADATVTTPGGHAEGEDAVVAQAARNHAAGTRYQHRFTDVVTDVLSDGATAHVRANLTLRVVPSGADAPVTEAGSVYRLTTRRTADGWRIRDLVVEPVWRTGEVPVPVAVR
ncbi:DUF4440 domain-containing protein [Cellulomonas sp. H30R-01]|uniref:nuclear transport factor 2 family protein n=1 Tax=Cellulomonas sp. H30R-01 TaxID=2704467 RepID=UPI00138BA08C|nr:nuclear transport factor 2 family protein [Cellulomonas sp. H30R-01]QHT55928.1 DUF4440 domain-containing protein [Cellulomonas sp. H30R-01]